MNTRLIFAAVSIAVAGHAYADGDGGCFPACATAPVAAEAASATHNEGPKLCSIPVVSEAMEAKAKFDEATKPIKEIVDIVQSPQGFLLKQVDAHVVKLPKWLPYALDPKGAVKARLITEVKSRTKEAVGLDKACVAPEPVETPVGEQA